MTIINKVAGDILIESTKPEIRIKQDGTIIAQQITHEIAEATEQELLLKIDDLSGQVLILQNEIRLYEDVVKEIRLYQKENKI